MNRINHFLQTCIFLSLVLVFCGCGKGSGPVGYVSGKVSVPGGENPAGLLIRFTDGGSGVGATAVVADGGAYSLKYKGNAGVPIGSYRISVTAYVPRMSDKEYADFLSLPADEQKRISDERNVKKKMVPQKYHKQNTSGLSYEIVEGSQNHDIVVTR